MTTVFNINPSSDGGYDVVAIDLVPVEERWARIAHFYAMGWTEREVQSEIRAVDMPRKLNEASHGLSMCLEYAVSYADPGDLIILSGRLFVVCPEGRA